MDGMRPWICVQLLLASQPAWTCMSYAEKKPSSNGAIPTVALIIMFEMPNWTTHWISLTREVHLGDFLSHGTLGRMARIPGQLIHLSPACKPQQSE